MSLSTLRMSIIAKSWMFLKRLVSCQSFSIIPPWFVYGRLDIIMYENNILWEVTTPKYTIHKKRILKQVHHLSVFCCNVFA